MVLPSFARKTRDRARDHPIPSSAKGAISIGWVIGKLTATNGLPPGLPDLELLQEIPSDYHTPATAVERSHPDLT